MPLKNNYIELSKKFGGPYTLIRHGVKRSIIDSIMRGSMPAADAVYEVAKILGVTIEELLTGETITSVKEPKAPYGLTDDERQWLDICKRAKQLSPERLEIALTVLEANLRALGLLKEEEKLWKKRA